MADFVLSCSDSERETRIHLEGTLDPDAVGLLKKAAEGMREKTVVLDFRRASISSDAVLSILVDALGSENVAAVGLDHHHELVLRCLGIAGVCNAEPRR